MKVYLAYDAAEYASEDRFRDSHSSVMAALSGTYDLRCAAISDATLPDALNMMARETPHAVVNLCALTAERPPLGRVLRQSLEKCHIPCTGADALTSSLQGMPLGMLAHSSAVAIPAFAIVHDLNDIDTFASQLNAPYRLTTFPILDSGTRQAVEVNEPEALAPQVRAMFCPSLHALRIEERIIGRQYTVVVIGSADRASAAATLPFECAETSVTESGEHAVSPLATTDCKRLQQTAMTMFNAMPDCGYLLCRLTLDKTGGITLTDVELNIDLFINADTPRATQLQAACSAFADIGMLLQTQIDIARANQGKTVEPCEVRFGKKDGFGLFASRDIAKGAVVVRGEGRPHRLISNIVVDQVWSADDRAVFSQYAWPMNARVSAFWSENPNAWKPLNHSCDPNTVLTGLDQIAARDIKRGEAISIDYATFYDARLPSFTCLCSTPACRITVTGTDYRLPALQAAYEGHFSSHVTALIESEARDMPFAMRRTRYGNGITARHAWKKNEILTRLTWTDFSDKPSRWTIQLGADQHAEMRPTEVSFSNHACDPNVEIDVRDSVMRALRDIAPGDDILCFYPSTEWKMDEPFQCECGAATCVGLIQGAEALAKEVLARYRLSPFIADKLAARERDAAPTLEAV